MRVISTRILTNITLIKLSATTSSASTAIASDGAQAAQSERSVFRELSGGTDMRGFLDGQSGENEYECDLCLSDIRRGSDFFDCGDCDFSLCGKC